MEAKSSQSPDALKVNAGVKHDRSLMSVIALTVYRSCWYASADSRYSVAGLTSIFQVVLFWAAAIFRGNKNGPPIVRWFSRRIRKLHAYAALIVTTDLETSFAGDKLTPWQVIAATLTCLCVQRLDLHAPS